jgi:hypothetical protein
MVGRAFSTKGKKRTLTIMGEKVKRKEPVGRPRHRWVDNIKMDLIEIEWDTVKC